MDKLNAILQIPERCLVNKKITKAFFKRNFELTSSEKMLLEDYSIVTGIDWVATLSPANANINRYQDAEYLFEEVQIISVQTGEIDFDRNAQRIAGLVQKYIPYPILLCINNNTVFVINTCDKKINLNDSTRRIIDKFYCTEAINQIAPTDQQQAFLNSLIFAEMDKTSLKTYYDSYTHRMIALQASQLSGSFVPRTQSRTKSDIETLEKIDNLQKEILAITNQIKKESQLNQRIGLNNQVQQKRKQIEELKALIIA